MSGGTPEEMAIIQSAFASLKVVDTYDEVFGVAAKLMPLRKSETLTPDQIQLVNEMCTGAIQRAETIKAKAAALPVPEPDPEPEPELGLPPPMVAPRAHPRAYSFAKEALQRGAAHEATGQVAPAKQLYTETVEKLLALRGSLADASDEKAAVIKLTQDLLYRIEWVGRPKPAPAVARVAPPAVVVTPVVWAPAAPFVPPEMPVDSDEDGDGGGGGGGWFSFGGASGPTEAERAERKRADAATRDADRLREQMHAMAGQLRQQQQAAMWHASAAQQHKTQEDQLRWQLQSQEQEKHFTAEQLKLLEENSNQLIRENVAQNEIEAKTALQRNGNDVELARQWLEEQRKAESAAGETVEWNEEVTMSDFSNMEEVMSRPGVWLASRVVAEEEGGMTIEKSKKVLLKQFVLQDSVQPFLHRMAALQRLQQRAAGLVVTPNVWFKDQESEAGVCTAYVELPRLETPVPLRDTAMCSDGVGFTPDDEGEDALPDPGSRVKMDGRTGEIVGGSGVNVEVKWDDDYSTSSHKPDELAVIQTAMERFGGGGGELRVPEVFTAILKAVMQLHAHGIVGVVSVDSIVIEMAQSGPRPVLTAGYARRGIADSIEGVFTAAAGAPELQEPDGEWTEKTDIWVVGTLLHRALYDGKEPVIMPGKSQPTLPKATGATTEHGRELTLALLHRDPAFRPTATAASSHPFFSGDAAVEALKEEGHVVDVETKLAILREHVELLKSQQSGHTLALTVQRTSLIDTVLTEIIAIPESRVARGELLRKLRVRFSGEDGIDAGGLTKELYTCFARELFDPEKCGLFEACDGETENPLFLPSASFDGDADIYEGVGKMLAKILVAGYPEPGSPGVPGAPGIPISLPLAPSLLRFLLYQHPTDRDYAAFDPQGASSLDQALEMEGFDDAFLCITFDDATAATDPRHDEDVTEANRHEYAHAKVMWQLVGSRLPQLTALRKGFEAVKLKNQLRLFSVTELMDVMCGQQSVDAEEIIAALEFTGFPRGTRTPQYVEETLQAWPEPSLKCFLRFITAMTCVPPDGGKIKIASDGDRPDAYPKSHTCFNRLDMPDYNSKARVTQRLQFCIDNVDAAGFGEA